MSDNESKISENNKPLKVGIVGGSIAGCALAIALIRLGCEVIVFERSAEGLIDRGAGLALPLPLVQKLKSENFIDKDMPFLPISQQIFLRQTKSIQEHSQSILWEQPVAFAANNWSLLFTNLRTRIPNHNYRLNSFVTNITEIDKCCNVELENGDVFCFDIVFCADGYNSIGRKLMYPEIKLNYAGYVAYRGLLDEGTVPNVKYFESKISYAVYKNGHGVFYLVPSQDGNKRQLNWLIYRKESLGMVSNTPSFGNASIMTSAPLSGARSNSVLDEFYDFVNQNLTNFLTEIIHLTPKIISQPIYDLFTPSYIRGRICLIGDAASLARPHTGSGAVKALDDAISIANILRGADNIDGAISEWDNQRSIVGNELVHLGIALGEALVNATPDWKTMDNKSMSGWWANVINNKRWYLVNDVK